MQGQEWKSKFSWFIFAACLIVLYKLIDSFSVILIGIGNLAKLLMPFILATIFSYILAIPCNSVEKTYQTTKSKFMNKHARGISIITIYVILILLFFIVINFALPALTESLGELAASLPNYYNSAIDYFKNAPEDSVWVKLSIVDFISQIQEINYAETVISWINLENASQYLKGILGITGAILNIFITIVVTTYMLLERDSIKEFIKKLSKLIFNENTYGKLRRYYRETDNIFFRFISGQLIDAVVVGVICTLAMLLIKVKYATLLGPLIGIFNIIPYFGAIVAVTFTVIITIFTGGFSKALTVAILIIILQRVDTKIINPKILGKKLDISPILVIFAVVLGGAYFGVLGMFLGVPVIAFIKILVENFIEEKMTS